MDKIDKVHNKLEDIKDLAKECSREIDDAKVQTLCETTFEVLAGLEKDFDYFVNKSEDAWK